MSNPLVDALAQLKSAAVIAGIEPNILQKLARPQRVLEATAKLMCDDGSVTLVSICRAPGLRRSRRYSGKIAMCQRRTWVLLRKLWPGC